MRAGPDAEELFVRCEKQLGAAPLADREWTALACHLFEASTAVANDDARTAELHARVAVAWSADARRAHLERQIAYAIRLADSDGDLLSEELFKLVSLCEDVHAMTWLGTAADDDDLETYRAAVTRRLRRQWSVARQIVEAGPAWTKNQWWSTQFKEPGARARRE